MQKMINGPNVQKEASIDLDLGMMIDGSLFKAT